MLEKSKVFDGQLGLLFSWLSFAPTWSVPTCYATGGNSPFINGSEGEHLMLEANYLSQYRLLPLNSTIALYLVDLSMQGSNTLPLPQPTPLRQHSAFHTAEQHDGINEYLSTPCSRQYTCV